MQLILGLPGLELALVLAAILVIGALIGSVGIGGLLLAPLLVGIVHMEPRGAIATSMAAFVATGLMAIWLFVRAAGPVSIRWPLVIATMPGALLGAVALWALPEAAAVAVLAGFLVLTGLRLLLRPVAAGSPTATPSTGRDVLLGAVTGFLSALTGTGGPMVLVPLLVWQGTALIAAIALGQIVQLPISALATAGNYASGSVDLVAGAAIGLLLLPGVVAGRRIAEALPLTLLTRGVACLLVAAGLWLALRLF